MEVHTTLIRSEKLHTEPSSEDWDIPESSKRTECSFEPAEDVKDAVVTDDGRTLRISMVLDPKYESALVNFLKANIKPGSKPVKQCLHRFNDEKCKAIGEEMKKLLSLGFV
jgi:hypothetical protein